MTGYQRDEAAIAGAEAAGFSRNQSQAGTAFGCALKTGAACLTSRRHGGPQALVMAIRPLLPPSRVRLLIRPKPCCLGKRPPPQRWQNGC